MDVIQKNDRIETLSDVVVPKKFYSRIDLGITSLNEIFGGPEMPGICPGTSFLFTGVPGGGKSTLALQLADLFSKNAGRNVVYNLGEENRFMVKMRADRLRLSGQFVITQIDNDRDLMEFCEQAGVEVLFQDSLQTLGEDLIGITDRFQAWKETSDVTVFLIGHSTKKGIFAGPNRIKHTVDCHVHLSIERGTGNRILEIEKNRFGPATIPYQFTMNADGINFRQIEEVVDEEEQTTGGHGPRVSRTADRRERIVNLIKEKMLLGDNISGYCFERFEVECSGGFWRGMLARACRELENEGHRVKELLIRGRTHFTVEKKP